MPGYGEQAWTGPDGYKYLKDQSGTTYVTVNGAGYPVDPNTGLIKGNELDPNVASYNNAKRKGASANSSTYNSGGTPAPAPVTAPTPTSTPAPTTPTTTPTNPNNPTGTGIPVNQYMANQVTNPTLTGATEFTPVLQQVQNNELLTGQNSTLDPLGTVTPQTSAVIPPQLTSAQGAASTVNPNTATQNLNPQGSQYSAAQIGANVPQGTAEQGQVNPLATIKGQLDQLYSEIEVGQIPTWARGSVNATNEYLAVRNMAGSTIGSTAIFGAIQNSALNIAAPDAATYFQMDLTNLANRQQMGLENLKNRQQALLSDQAAVNAAQQFNAANEQQMQQFMSTMVANINNQNADRTQAMSIFNAGERNKINSANAQYLYESQTFNAQQTRAINEFNANLRNQREQFNAQNAFAIEQSNVLWRRSVNTANTAAVNAANQANVQNRFNISQTALNNIWQQFRDEASWVFTASENEKNRQFNAAMAANNRTFISDNQPNTFAQAAGAFAGALLLG